MQLETQRLRLEEVEYAVVGEPFGTVRRSAGPSLVAGELWSKAAPLRDCDEWCCPEGQRLEALDHAPIRENGNGPEGP